MEELAKKKRTNVNAEALEGLENERDLQSSSHSIQNTPKAQFPAHTAQPDTSKIQESPPLLRHMIYGINEVTKRLETQTQHARRLEVVDIPQPPVPLRYIFVCRFDVDPPLLIDHLPHLVAAYNSNCPRNPIKLVTLPQGAELLLAQNLGIRRVAVIAIDVRDF